MLIMACSGLMYGMADIAEDWKLVTILEKGAPVDPASATEANTLTRIKLVTIAFSVIGGVMFLLLTLVSNPLKLFQCMIFAFNSILQGN